MIFLMFVAFAVFVASWICDAVSSWDFDRYPRIHEKTAFFRDRFAIDIDGDGAIDFNGKKYVVVYGIISTILIVFGWVLVLTLPEQTAVGIFCFPCGLVAAMRFYNAFDNWKAKKYHREQGWYIQ